MSDEAGDIWRRSEELYKQSLISDEELSVARQQFIESRRGTKPLEFSAEDVIRFAQEIHAEHEFRPSKLVIAEWQAEKIREMGFATSPEMFEIVETRED